MLFLHYGAVVVRVVLECQVSVIETGSAVRPVLPGPGSATQRAVRVSVLAGVVALAARLAVVADVLAAVIAAAKNHQGTKMTNQCVERVRGGVGWTGAPIPLRAVVLGGHSLTCPPPRGCLNNIYLWTAVCVYDIDIDMFCFLQTTIFFACVVSHQEQKRAKNAWSEYGIM